VIACIAIFVMLLQGFKKGVFLFFLAAGTHRSGCMEEIDQVYEGLTGCEKWIVLITTCLCRQAGTKWIIQNC
jgi:hypothetical protein